MMTRLILIVCIAFVSSITISAQNNSSNTKNKAEIQSNILLQDFAKLGINLNDVQKTKIQKVFIEAEEQKYLVFRSGVEKDALYEASLKIDQQTKEKIDQLLTHEQLMKRYPSGPSAN